MATTVDAKLLKSTKFPAEFNQKVDMKKVNLEVMKKWIAGRISNILGNEDDVVIELCFNLVEGERFPDIKKLQISLTGFLEKDTPKFCQELWKLMLSAQSSPQGVPKELLEAKKLELMQEKIEAEKAAEDARRRREIDDRRDRDIDSIRNRERGDRGRGGRGDSYRGPGRGGRDFDRRRSPMGRRDSRDRGGFRGPPREIDSYMPGRTGSRRQSPRRRSPSPSVSPVRASARSRSRSPRRRRSPSSVDSRSPTPRRKPSISRSPSPDRRRGGRGRGRGGRARSPDRRPRRRSYTPSVSRSRSPPRKRRRSDSRSLSRSPFPKKSRRNTSSMSRSPSADSNGKDIIRGAKNGRQGRDRDERRLTRSHSRSLTPPRRRRRSPSRSLSRSPERRRQRSMERYEPSKNRRRNSSSPPPDSDRRRADTSEDDRPARKRSPSPEEDVEMESARQPEINPSQRRASELKEILLRERIKKMRTMSTCTPDTKTNSQ